MLERVPKSTPCADAGPEGLTESMLAKGGTCIRYRPEEACSFSFLTTEEGARRADSGHFSRAKYEDRFHIIAACRCHSAALIMQPAYLPAAAEVCHLLLSPR